MNLVFWGVKLWHGIQKNSDLIDIKDDENCFDFFMSCFNTNHGKTTSYKFCFIKSILDNLFNCETFILSFDTLNSTFLKIYWNLICKYNLPQFQSSNINQKSSIEIAILETKNKFELDVYSDYDFYLMK